MYYLYFYGFPFFKMQYRFILIFYSMFKKLPNKERNFNNLKKCYFFAKKSNLLTSKYMEKFSQSPHKIFLLESSDLLTGPYDENEIENILKKKLFSNNQLFDQPRFSSVIEQLKDKKHNIKLVFVEHIDNYWYDWTVISFIFDK